MANMRLKLSDYGIGRLKPPPTGRLEVADLICPGLFLRITPRDVRSWSVAYKVRGEGGESEFGRPLVGIQHRITLGRYPQLGLSAARDKARVLLEVVLEGTDPRPERAKVHRERRLNTVANVCKQFIEQDVKPTVESWQRIERSLAIHVIPTLGDRPIRKIGRQDIHDLLNGVAENTGKGAAATTMKHLHQLFDFAVGRELIDRNPAHKLKRRDLKPNGDARRSLNDAELKSIWDAAEVIGYPAGPALRLLMLTGQRRNDWTNASRAEIDTEKRVLEIPSRRFKSRRDHVVPLVGEAWDIVSGLPQQTGGDFLFSNRAGKVPINSWAKAKNQIDKLTGPLEHWSLHDLRSTAESRMAELGIVQEHRDAVLGHQRPGLQKTYNKFDYAEAKRAALAAYATHLMEIVK